MGRLTTGAQRRRGLLRRPLLLFALLLLGPAAGFCILGWNSLLRERIYREREMQRTAQDLLTKRMRDAAAALERIRLQETDRHYFEYAPKYMPRSQGAALSFLDSPLNRRSSDSRILGYFNWMLIRGKAYNVPDVFPAGNVTLRQQLAEGYGGALRDRLLRAPANVDLRTGRGRIESYSQRVVAANEEQGALLEEIELQNRAEGGQVDTQYLKNFENRANLANQSGDAAIRVRYTPFRYLARPKAVPGPALIAWRMVWVPAEQARWREVKNDRWIIQGYALDPRSLFPSAWESIGGAEIVRGDALAGSTARGIYTSSLAIALDADVAGVSALPGGGKLSVYDESLVLAARADLDVARSAWHDARNRFLFLVAGLVVVVAVGFFVLVRSVRREVLLARRKEDFIAAITHELKTPLTGIRMYADMLREGWVESREAADGYASRILDETDRLGHLVNQVLDLAALERGVATLNAQQGDLGEAVTSAVALMETKAEEAGVELGTEIEADLPLVTFDPRLVRPLVLNLVDNAIKYSARAEAKEVRVRLSRDGERVVLAVADRGVGISSKARKGLFQPFQRAGDELTRDAPGVGIGLALVKRYADAHNARVHLISEPGEGTTVEVSFRL